MYENVNNPCKRSSNIQHKLFTWLEVLSVVLEKVHVFWGYDALLLGEQSRTFQRIILPLSSITRSPRIMKKNATWSHET